MIYQQPARNQSNTAHQGAPEVVRWMLTEGRHNARARQFGEEMCQRIVAAGIPIWRGFCFVATLHPEVAATAYVWNRDETGARRSLAGHELVNLPEFTQSPIASVRKSRTVMRRRLSDPLCPLDFPILAQFKAEGATDYIAIPMIRSDGEVNVITFLTDFAGGFADSEATGLEDIAHALGLITELQSARRIARTLLDTYIGRRTGKRVLSGAIQRGSGETIRAVIWDNDLRGFTTMADSLPREALTILLNHYFEIMAGAVTAEGGEVLKFIGDGMLAIFEITGDEQAAQACLAALAAAQRAIAALAVFNGERRAAAQPPIGFGIALHLGEVYYGNIGAPGRLDFTVIGPAVNHAARLEKLSAELGRSVVVSASFAAHVPELLESLGVHYLRGVVEPQELFSPIAS